MDDTQLIYDWNIRSRRHSLAAKPIQLVDETLRDGLQGPSVVDPPLATKKRIVELSAELGVHVINLGLPGAGPRAVEHVTGLARHIRDERLPIQICCAARTLEGDIRPIVEISQAVGIEIEVMAFIGSSPIRQFVEGWSVERLTQLATDAIGFAVSEGLPITFVTEDTVRSRPAVLAPLFRAAIDRGAHRLCLCDTVGHATPDGVRDLIEFTRHVIEGTGADIGIDWHGHNDRGLALNNSIRALEYGADRVHGTALGIGERVGNASLDLLLLNLKLLGEIDNDLSCLASWCRLVSESTRWAIPPNHPLTGTNAFRTATGVHAAAVIKALKKGDDDLADRVYSGVPASLIGARQHIDIGPMSGRSNVIHWLGERGLPADPAVVQALYDAAKSADHVLGEEEIRLFVTRAQAAEPA